MSKAINLMMFLLGTAVGSVVTLQYVKQKHEKVTQEEIDSVQDVSSEDETDIVEKSDDVKAKAMLAKEKPDIEEYTNRLHKHGYTNYSDISFKNKKEGLVKPMTTNKPYVIPPEEFGELDDYESVGLTYYADQILADDNDDLIDDVDDIVGFESLSRFGEYEDDSVFVRNDQLKCDYEILLDQRKYSDVVKKRPREV